ncbi:FAM72 domain containing protein [Tubulinosema ratisbonensis]|uniref:FAM72 domain containing protein n=1 Tax=Tubulinosema ratisbonensis TaxID=291195 RepID=A0A437AIR6_9MICR|nr:FAM72 domain containing protein [Tubulinosema ratisbonensis]
MRRNSTNPYTLLCKECSILVAPKAYESVLLTNQTIPLFSTNEHCNNTREVYNQYTSAYCSCKVRDIACKNCGNIVGYNIYRLCKLCSADQSICVKSVFLEKNVSVHKYNFNKLENEYFNKECTGER